MADRGLSANAIVELGLSSAVVYNLLRIDFSTKLYYTDAPHDIDYDDGDGLQAYISSANCPEFPDIKESLGMKPSTVPLEFSGMAANHALTLTENYKNAPIFIYRYIYGKAEAITLFSGFLDSYRTKEDQQRGTSSVTWSCVSHWANWEAQNGRYVSSTSQARIGFSNDLFFEFAGVTDGVLDYWGGYRNQAGISPTEIQLFNNAFNVYGMSKYAPTAHYLAHIEPRFEGFINSVYNYEGRSASSQKLPVTYGVIGTPGIPVFRALSGADLSYLWVVYALSEGECEGLSGDRIMFGDELRPFNDESFSSSAVTKGTASGATTDGSSYAVGDTVITLASAGTGTIIAGDAITFAGDPERYIVYNGDTNVADGGDIKISGEGLKLPISGTTAITVEDGSLINYAFYSGADAQATTDAPDDTTNENDITATALIAAATYWTTAHDGNGISYCIVRYLFDSDAFDSPPEPVFNLKGKRVLDPNNTGNPVAYTTNPAWLLRDYLINDRFGKGIPAANLVDFDVGATYCATEDHEHDGTSNTIPLFAFSGAIDTGRSIKKNADALLFAMRGDIAWVGGNYKLVIERHDATSNLIKYSEQFHQSSAWVNSSSLVVTQNVSTPLAPDETQTADKLEDTFGIAARYIFQFYTSAHGFDSSNTYTFSVYIAKDSVPRSTRNVKLEVSFHGSIVEYCYVLFDTKTGEYSNTNSTTIVEDYNSDWWRLTVTGIPVDLANTDALVTIQPAFSANFSTTQDPSLTGSIIAWGAQLVIGGSAGVYSRTGYQRQIQNDASNSAYSFNEDNLSSEFGVGESGIKSLLNLVEYEYIEPTIGYAPEIVYEDSVAYLAEDNGRELKKKITNKFEINRYRAKHRASTILKQSRQNISGNCSAAKADAVKIECGNIIDITRASQGWLFKKFRVHAMRIGRDGSVEITDFREFEPSSFDWSVSTEDVLPDDTKLLDPFDVTTIAPTAVTLSTATQRIAEDGSTLDRGEITWTAPAGSVYLSHYNIEYRQASDTNYTPLPIVMAGDTLEAHFDAVVGVVYDVSVQAVNSLGKRSVWVDDTAGDAHNTAIGGTKVSGLDVQLVGTDAWNNASYYYRALFESLDVFNATSAVLSYADGLTLTSNTGVIAYIERHFDRTQVPIGFDKDRRFKAKIKLNGFANTGGNTEINQKQGTNSFIGFILSWNSGTSKIDIASRSVDSGGLIETTSAFASVSDGATVDFSFFFDVSAGTIDFTVDDGTTVTTTQHTTRMPSDTTGAAILCRIFMPTATGVVTMKLSELITIQEP